MQLFKKSKIINYQNEGIDRLERNLRKLMNGDTNIDLVVPDGGNYVRTERDQFIKLNQYMSKIKESDNKLAKDMEDLSNKIKDGKLESRIDTSEYNGLYAKIGNYINASIEAISGPMNVAGNILGEMANNDFTKEMEGNYKGQLLEFSSNINTVRTRLLSVEDAFIRVSNGDISRLEELSEVGRRSENDKLVPAMVDMMQTIQNVINEVKMIAAENINGNIVNTRGHAEGFKGGYKEIVVGINNILEAVVKPFSEATEILKKTALNDYTQSMNTDYKGDFSILANAINDVQKRLLKLQDTAEKISNGDISELENFRQIGKRSENDHIVPAFTSMMESIQALIDITTKFSAAAEDGNLSARADVEKFKGEYGNIVKELNNTLDAVAKPMKEVTEVMSHIGIGDLSLTVKGDYKGDYAILTNAVSSTTVTLNKVIEEIGNILSEIAQGNFNILNVREFKGDFAIISDSLNKIVNSLNDIFREINGASEQVAAGAGQISNSSQSLSQGSEEQASAIEEITSSITEMATQVKQNATNATKADELSLTAKEDAVKGNDQMKEMVQAMHDINESSTSISKIIKVIDDIAFQTNILALNAAVEAARAGQYGKGFAVVAEEVKNLAQQSADAAKETTSMIEGSIEKVGLGTKIANNTAQALNEIVDSITKAAELVGHIASASNEQASAISQINQAIEQVSQVIQTTSATAEEGASASEELSGQAEMLKQTVQNVKLRDANDKKFTSLDKLSPDILRMVEEMIEKKDKRQGKLTLNNVNEKNVAGARSRPQIVLDDKEFGKY
ncbi:MAG: methyl-accepting chemotaxis protein [Bacillota bacterium]|nr:methyl-accepting chemotaxis protein [Bacillota bacterium]